MYGGLCPRRGNTHSRRGQALGRGAGVVDAGILLRQLKGKTDTQEKWRSNTQEGEEGLSWSREQEQRLEGAVGACLPVRPEYTQ